VKKKLLQHTLPTVSPWALVAMGQINNRESNVMAAMSACRNVLSAESFYRVLEERELLQITAAHDSMRDAMKALKDARNAVWDARFDDAP
jgi:hypothetical protein